MGLEDKKVGGTVELEVLRVGACEGEADLASGPRILQHHDMNLICRQGVFGRSKQRGAIAVTAADRRGEDPRAGLFDGQLVGSGDLELDLDGVIFAVLHIVKGLEPVVNRLEVVAELHHLGFAHEELSGLGEVRTGKHGRRSLRVQQQLLGIGVRLRVGYQVLADLGVDVVLVVREPNGVVADRHAVGQFI